MTDYWVSRRGISTTVIHLNQSEMYNTMKSVLLGKNGEGTSTYSLKFLKFYQVPATVHALSHVTT